ncbi:polyprenyl synthetase family protein [Geobacter pelophilus]|jgi:octaprenyl-diphosphate synthase|uniref:Polyprenyl synthetase family protein n=1 Tax=Geoanaerobacter pelophilus TaxID=60036 RepID=A0AAW4LB57_9BACT|nr:polyprenyl synthetase family protein [Geoanaerobacter pelophilus]MBT0665616.1 polyprenyl synthetase family protein [Geoanaerobacter pelophilus]
MEAVLALIGDELIQVEQQFRKDLASDVPLIRKVGEYVLSSGGKRIRPALLLLAAKLCEYSGDRHVPLASVVEFIHTATLLHDDVVDNANLRRGIASANTLWGNEASVLVGDFLFSKSFSLMVADGDLDILRVLSGATTMIAEGEVLQLVCTSDLTMTEARYIDVVKCKTAVLISAACQAGAILGKVSTEMENALRDFGMDLGIAFQLMDDVLDYSADQEEFGKSIGHDIEEGKITLPLIHALMHCTDVEKDRVGDIVTAEIVEDQDFAFVFDLVQRHQGIEFTVSRARDYVESAKASLASFPESTIKSALFDLSDYVVTRQR